MTQYTVQRDSTDASNDRWFIFLNGIAIAGPMTYSEAETELDRIETAEQENL